MLGALALLLLAAPPVPAPWDKAFNPDTTAMLAVANAGAIPAKSATEILLSETLVRIEADGRATTTRRSVVRILTHEGVEQWGTATTQWEPWYEEKPEIRARVITPDGVSHELDSSTIAEGAARQDHLLLDDRRVLHAPLPAVMAGAVIEKQTVTRQTAPFFDAGVVQREALEFWNPARQVRLTLDWANAANVKFELRGIDAKPVDSSAGGRTVLTWETGPWARRTHYESHFSPDEAQWGQIAWSNGKSWNAVASRYSAIVDQQIAKAPPLVTPPPKGAPREVARVLLAALQGKVRYTGLEFGASSIVPAMPATTLERGFGDCKDKASVLVAALRASGLDAHVALLSTGPGANVPASLPGMGLFNHAIVFVGGSDPFWIDPTVESGTPGGLPAEDSNRLALVASPKTKALSRTPPIRSTENATRTVISVRLPIFGDASLHADFAQQGASASESRSVALHTAPETLKEQWEKWSKATFQGEGDVSVILPEPGNLQGPFRASVDVPKSNVARMNDSDGWLVLSPTRVFEQLPWALTRPPKKAQAASAQDDDGDDGKGNGGWDVEDVTKRKTSWYLDRPFTSEVRTVVTLPLGTSVRSQQANDTQRIGTAAWSETWAVAGTALTVTFRFDSGAGPYSVDEGKKLNALVDTLRLRRNVVWFDRTGTVALTQGRVAEAARDYRALIAARPADGEPHVFLARAYLAAGLGDAARDEARKAVALSPASPFCAMSLGEMYEYDRYGRPWHPGMDLREAEKWLRVAAGLPEGEDVASSALANLLQFGSNGEWWGPGARMDEAIALLEKLEEKSERSTAAQGGYLHSALLRAGKYDRLRELVRKTSPPSPADVSLLIAATAIEKGGAAAIAELERSDDLDSRDEVRGWAVSMLLQLRHYEEAAALAKDLRAPANRSGAASFADLLARMHKHETVKLDLADPAGVTRTALLSALGASDVPLDRLYVPESLAEAKSSARQARRFRSGSAAGADGKGGTRYPADVIADFTLAEFDTKAEGDGNAWRVHLTPAVSGVKDDSWFFLTKSGGGLRLIGDDEDLTCLGRAAISALEKKDLAAARRWLDWAREAEKNGSDLGTFKGSVFAHLWTRGKAASLDETRVAAAALLAGKKDEATHALAVLEPALPTAPARDRVQIERALIGIYENLDRPADALRLSEELEARFPDESAPFFSSVQALVKSKRLPDAEKKLRGRIAELPDDLRAERFLADVLAQAGDIAGARAMHRQLTGQGNAGEGESWNMLAWESLFGTGASEETEKDAERAVELTHSAAALHTLASVEAELGKLSDARNHLLAAIDVRGDDEPAPDDWYVWGRIAESLELQELAATYYAKVPHDETPLSTWTLAQRRQHGFSNVSR